MALPHLPSEHVDRAFNQLKLRAPLGEQMKAVRELLEYFHKNWINNTKTPPSTWSTFKRFIRTNNDVEGWHRKLNSALDEDHPNMYKLIERIVLETADLPLQIRLVAQEKLMRRTRKDAASKHAQLEELWARYEAKEFTVSQYLRECSTHIDHTET